MKTLEEIRKEFADKFVLCCPDRPTVYVDSRVQEAHSPCPYCDDKAIKRAWQHERNRVVRGAFSAAQVYATSSATNGEIVTMSLDEAYRLATRLVEVREMLHTTINLLDCTHEEGE